MSQIAYARRLKLKLCHICGYTCQLSELRCPRCSSSIHTRKPGSIARTWALLVTALILYVPANLLPVMHANMFGKESDNTIMSGVIEFWHAGSWDIATLIFFASIVVPCIKFLVLGTLLVTCQRKSKWAMRERGRLYRFIERIGYWSMLDVLVVALVAALLQFHSLSSVDPRVGIVFFGFVVVLTMLATMSFDPRIIWDAEVENV
ncbi:paraquat-inducible protein A [Pseudomonas viridiflava]|uniref:paraquat-inducible protein A n=1 Tax=Pseudomonas viridiflava TaxID=33069 RepID=UPI000C08C0D3|nr:paraquat-inducible protein A [Pseudomonas viridiflava]PHN61825.1 paraquat-inducible protein A [Pseudomonas viridiflava]